MVPKHSRLVERFFTDLARSAALGPILDLACGRGRNGLYLAEHRLPVVFADDDEGALAEVRAALSRLTRGEEQATAHCWSIDLEADNNDPLAGRRFGGIMAFRYLHRPLMPAIRQSLLPGGILLYETFTVDQPAFGRPKNPDYLLRHGELQAYFGDWNILHYFEGVRGKPETGDQQAIAQIVAQKPA